MKFAGIDFGWVSGASGLCCLQWENGQLNLIDLTTKLEVIDVLNWLDNWIAPHEAALIGVDAPTIIPNKTGMRLPDKLTHQYFGKYHAGCYPANLGRPFALRTVSFGNELIARGFNHAPEIASQKPGRYQIEVFPHPAIVNLFGLNRILKYKKGKLADRAAQLKLLRHYIVTILPTLEPGLSWNEALSVVDIPHQITGKTLKTIEDKLDSLICAYVAAYWWYWGTSKNLVLGNKATGYIVVPMRGIHSANH